VLIDAIARRAKDFDVIHTGVGWLPLPLLRRLGVPLLSTMHGRRWTSRIARCRTGVSRRRLRLISENRRVPLPEASWVATIQHRLQSQLFRPPFDQGSYLAFLGRLAPEKGPEDAIRIAQAAGKPLRMAAKIPRSETRYFKKKLERYIDGRTVQLIGEVDDPKKQLFLADAAALFPIDWPEPFGLVMIEAMPAERP
jgi:glycosyltransferase involved in cell wall biosynthesis